MKKKPNPEEIFHLLENADDEDIFYLSEHYLSADPSDMERIFTLSEKKYEMDQQDPEQKSAETGQIKQNIIWHHILMAAAACLIITVGAVKGIMNMQHFPEQQTNFIENPVITETSSTPPHTEIVFPVVEESTSTESQIIQTSFIPETESIHETVTETIFETMQTTAEIITENTETSQTSTMQITETLISSTEEEMTDTEAPETEADIELIIPTETSIEPIIENTEPTEPIETSTENTTESEEYAIPGFIIQTYHYDGLEEKFDYITADLDENPSEILNEDYRLSWIPEGYVLDTASKKEYAFSQIYKNQEIQFTLCEYLQSEFFITLEPESAFPITINENPGFYYQTIYAGGLLCGIFWKQDGYVFSLETYTISFSDAIKIAESIMLAQQ